MADRQLLVKKYGNRRLYDTEASRYITLDELALLIKSGRDVKIIDAKSKADLTKMVLLQIISDQEKEQDLIPIAFLKKMIQMGDESMREALPRYLSFSLDAFISAQKRFEKRYENLAGSFLNPLMWVTPPGVGEQSPDDQGASSADAEQASEETEPEPERPETPPDDASASNQLRALKQQVDQIQAMISKLGDTKE